MLRRKYEFQQFSSSNAQNEYSMSSYNACLLHHGPSNRQVEEQQTGIRHGLGHPFRNSWRKKDTEHKSIKKTV